MHSSFIIQALMNNRTLYEQFTSHIRNSKDGFSVVADYFSRGVFNKVCVNFQSNNATHLSKLLYFVRL